MEALKLALLIGLLHGSFTLAAGKCAGVCVKMDECENTFGGIQLVDLKFNDKDYEEADCSHYLEVCCDLEHVVTTRAPPVIAQTADQGNVDDTKTTEKLKYNAEQSEFLIYKPSFVVCGKRNPEGISFRLANSNHNKTEFGEFPWMVAILQAHSEEETKQSSYSCGGSLIAPNVILTAAHCVMDKQADQLTVRAGEWDTMTTLEFLPHQERPVSSIILHPKFNRNLLFHDIALLIVAENFTAADNVQLACLPPMNMDFTSDSCFATGWGKSAFDSKSYHAIMKRVPLPMVDRVQCQTALRTTRLGPLFRLHESFICAGGEEGIDTCTGDGGSPLVCPIEGEENRFYQAGIVAWGINCGQAGIPGVYVRTSLYTDWIDKEVLKHNIVIDKRMAS